jgi:flagellar hook-basal body complex protein FliE
MSIEATRLMALRSSILEQNSALQRAAGLGTGGVANDAGTARPAGFGDALRSALNAVNESQSNASSMSAAYERGETTDIAAVMLARQQASIGFEATLQVRNRLLSAYKDIMSMPV